MRNEMLLPLLISFAITAVIGPKVIAELKKLHASQTEREELESHQKKTGTPTMGGIMFLLAIVVTSAFFMGAHPSNFAVLVMMLLFGVIGFLDDFLKVVLHRPDGLIAWQKFLLQFFVCVAFIAYMKLDPAVDMGIKIPFYYGGSVDIGILIYPLLFLAIGGTVNGVNFTDGLDGLATTVTLVVSGFFAIVAVIMGSDLWLLPVIVIGALLGFLLFNANPARVFMGDTGSLALGGFVAGMACLLGLPVFIVLFGIIYLVEVLSVIIQVLYFKKTHGKRIFRMAPIHHHYELGGWSETKIVAVFSIVTAIFCIIAFMGLVPADWSM